MPIKDLPLIMMLYSLFRRKSHWVVVAFLTLLSFQAKAQSVVINEVLINGPGTCDGNCVPNTEEWVELHNMACFAINIGCYRICDGDFCVTIPAGTVIPAQGFYLIGSSNSVIGNAVLNLNIGNCNGCANGPNGDIGIFSNSAEQLVLTNAAGTIIDAVIWGGGQSIPATQTASAPSGCADVTVNLPFAGSTVYEVLTTSGNQGCVLARAIDGGANWEERCPEDIYPVPSPGASNDKFIPWVVFPGICRGGATTLSATGGTGIYSWSPATGLQSTIGASVIASPSETTTYTVTSLSLNGCLTNNWGLIGLPVDTIPEIFISPSDILICSGQTIGLTGNGAQRYSWSTGQTSNTISLSPNSTTSITVIGYNSLCASEPETIVINVLPLPAISVTALDNELCLGESVTLTAIGTGNFSWQPATGLSQTTGSIVVASPAAYTVYTVTTTNGFCSNQAAIWVDVGMPGIAQTLPVNPPGACNTIVSLQSIPPESGVGKWVILEGEGGTFDDPFALATTFSGLAGSTYQIGWAVTTLCGTGTDTIEIAFADDPQVSAGADAQIMFSQTTELQATGGVAYSWFPAAGLSDASVPNPVASPEVTTTYTVSITTAEGCTLMDYVTVTVTYEALLIPNVFTPNGDGLNDTWDIKGLRVVYPDCEVKVFNRWGKEVYSDKGYSESWNGKTGNQKVTDGVYFYSINLGTGKQILKGQLSIVR